MLHRGHIAGVDIDDDGIGTVLIRSGLLAITVEVPKFWVILLYRVIGPQAIIGHPCTWDGTTIDLKGEAPDENRSTGVRLDDRSVP